jgi:hypothetical protein
MHGRPHDPGLLRVLTGILESKEMGRYGTNGFNRPATVGQTVRHLLDA